VENRRPKKNANYLLQVINKIFISSTINNRILYSANIEQLKQHLLSFYCRQTSISVLSLWPPQTSLSVLSLWPPQTSLSVLPDVHYKQPWLLSTNHPPRTTQTVLFRWTLSSHHGPHGERRYPSFLRVHDNQLSLRCNHQPSTFKRRSSWSSSRCTLSSHPSHQFSYSLKGALQIHSPSTKYSLNAFLIIIHSLFTSYGPVLSLEALNVA